MSKKLIRFDWAMKKLRYESLSDEEKKMYDRSVENRRIEMSVEYTRELEATHKKAVEIAKKMILAGSKDDFISQMTDLTLEQIEALGNATK